MQNNKKRNSFLAAALASLIIASTATASVMSGCGDGSGDNSETVAVVETSIVSRMVDGVYVDENGNILSTDPSGKKQENAGATVSPEALAKAKEENKKNDSDNKSGDSVKSDGDKQSNDNNGGGDGNNADNNAGDNKNDNNDNNNKSEDSEGGEGDNDLEVTDLNNLTPEQKKKHERVIENIEDQKENRNDEKIEESKELVLEGNKYKVGDTITCVYNLKAPEKLTNFQGEITYDTSCLKCVDAWLVGSAQYGGIINYKLDGMMKFNGVNIGSGFNYVNEDKIIVAVYEVTGAGETTTNFEWQVVTGKSGDKLVDDGKPVDGLEVKKSYSYDVYEYEDV